MSLGEIQESLEIRYFRCRHLSAECRQQTGPSQNAPLNAIPRSRLPQGSKHLRNNHILSKILTYITTILKPSTSLLGPLDPWGYNMTSCRAVGMGTGFGCSTCECRFSVVPACEISRIPETTFPVGAGP